MDTEGLEERLRLAVLWRKLGGGNKVQDLGLGVRRRCPEASNAAAASLCLAPLGWF